LLPLNPEEALDKDIYQLTVIARNSSGGSREKETGCFSPFIERKQPVPFVSPLPAALTDLVPPPAAVLGRRGLVIGEPLRAAEAILTGLVERRADTFHDLLAGPLTPLLCADFLDRRIAEPLQESVTISGAEAIQRLIDERGVELQ